MKFKIYHIYIIAAIAAVITLFFITREQSEVNNKTQSELPDDEIHKGFQEKLNTPPGKGNVSESVIHQMEVLKKAVEENPNDTSKIREYADFLGAAHKQDEAIVQYQKILKKDPKRTDILTSIAFIYYNRGEYLEAETYINKVIAIDKNNLQAHYNLGAIAANQGDYAKAKLIWTKLVNEHPGTEMAELAKSSLSKL